MHKRMHVLFFAFVFLFTVLILRVADLTTSTNLTQAAQRQSTFSLKVSENRAQIYDRNMQSMVNNQSQYKAVVMPEPSCLETLLKIATDLKREDALKQMKTGKPFVANVNTDQCTDPNIRIFETKQRYADNELATHLLGYLNAEKTEGVTGIEKSYNEFLNKYSTKTTVQFPLNGIGHTMKGSDVTVSEQGLAKEGVVLTLDSSIQDIVERVGGKSIEKGAIVLLDAKTGEIRASASFPDYNPNSLAKSVKDSVNTPMINRVLYAFNVGSTFKIATAAAALDAGLLPGLTYRCEGKIDVKGQVFNCAEHEGHGVLNMQQALRESCNPYYINLGLKVGGAKVRQVASDMGFGKEFLLADSIKATKGTLPGDKELFNPADVANLSFGQGVLMANPLQVSELIFSVLNEGRALSPTLVKGVSYDGQTIADPAALPAPITAMTKSTAGLLKEYLVRAVAEKTSDNTKPRTVSAGGKSATAQTGKTDAEGNEIYQTWFTGFFPAEQPKYIVTVLVENGFSGSTTTGPIFTDIADMVTAVEQAKG